MAKIPAKAMNRLKVGLKKYQPILEDAKSRDINESDTVTIVTDVLENIFGYEKFKEVTSEYAIKGNRCDLAIELEGKLSFLLEVKAVGLDLKDQHVMQAINYAANQGVDWVGLTNGVEWRIYKVIFAKPVDFEMVLNFNLLDISSKKVSDLECIALLAKEVWEKEGIVKHHSIQQIMNRYNIGAILQSDVIVSVLKRELKRMSKDIKASDQDILFIMQNEVLKRELVDSERAKVAQKAVTKSEKKVLRKVMKEREMAPKLTVVHKTA